MLNQIRQDFHEAFDGLEDNAQHLQVQDQSETLDARAHAHNLTDQKGLLNKQMRMIPI